MERLAKERDDLEALALDETQMAALYAEFAEEDYKLAEEGIARYVEALTQEDDV